MPMTPAMTAAIALVNSLREEQLVRVHVDNVDHLMVVSRGPRRSDGAFGSPESTRVTVSYGLGKWSFEVVADAVAAGRVGIEPVVTDLAKPWCFYIVHTEVDENGYIPVIVTEDEPGYSALSGRNGGRAWYWGKTYAEAAARATEANALNGIDGERALEIVSSSMRLQTGLVG